MSTEQRVIAMPQVSIDFTRNVACLFASFFLLAASPVLLLGQEHHDDLGKLKRSIDLTGIKCIVSGVANADPAYTASFKQGVVYFSSEAAADHFRFWTSPKHAASAVLFDSEIAGLIVKANHQLALTEQYVQSHCPVTGNPINGKYSLRIGGLKIAFENKTASQVVQKHNSLIHRATFVFADQAFDRAFQPSQVAGTLVAQTPELDSKSDKNR